MQEERIWNISKLDSKPTSSRVAKSASQKRENNLDLCSGEVKKFVYQECLLEFTSTYHIQRHKCKNSDSTQPPAKRARRSDTAFDFNDHCLFCGSIV